MGSRILDFPAASSHTTLKGLNLTTFTALIRQSEGWWIGWILEVHGVIGQERTRSELLDTLQITLREILEYETPEVSLRTESEVEEIKTSDILEFSDHEASHQTESGFEEVKIRTVL